MKTGKAMAFTGVGNAPEEESFERLFRAFHVPPIEANETLTTAEKSQVPRVLTNGGRKKQ